MIKKFLKNNFWTILLAALIGFIYFLPNILIPYFLEKEGYASYHLLSLEAPVLDEIGSYGVKIKEIMEGKIKDGDPYLFEYKNYPTIWGNYYMSLLAGKLLRLFFIQNPTLFFVIGDFLFPALNFILAFYIFYLLTRNRRWSYLSALVLISFPNLSSLLGLVSSASYQDAAAFLKSISQAFDPDFTRLLVPAFSFPFFLTAMLCLLYWLEKDTSVRRWAVGISTGLLFYIYFYYWMFWAISLVILFSGFLIYRRWETVWSFLKIGAISLLLALPFWLNFYQLLQSPSYQVLSGRAGLALGHFFDFGSGDNYVMIVLAILTTGLAMKRGLFNKKFFAFLASILLTTLIVINLQLIFGFNPQPDHWGSRVNIYILVLALLVAIFYILKLKNFTTLMRYAPIVIVPALMIVALWAKTTNSSINKYNYLVFPDVIKSYEWINENILTDKVLVTPSTKSNIALPFFTGVNIYAPPINFSIAPTVEITDRFLEAYRIFGVSADFLKNNLESGLASVDPRVLFAKRRLEFDPLFFLLGDLEKTRGNYNYQSKNQYPASENVERFLALYEKISPPSQKLSLKYRADYLYWGPYEKLFGHFKPEKFKNLEKIYDYNLVQIYKIN